MRHWFALRFPGYPGRFLGCLAWSPFVSSNISPDSWDDGLLVLREGSEIGMQLALPRILGGRWDESSFRLVLTPWRSVRGNPGLWEWNFEAARFVGSGLTALSWSGSAVCWSNRVVVAP